MSKTRPENLPDDFIIEEEWNFSHLKLSPEDRMHSVDYDSKSKKTLFLKNHELIVCDENLDILIKKQITLPEHLRTYYLKKAYFLPNGYIVVNAHDSCHALLLFDPSLEPLADEDLDIIYNETHIFTQDSNYVLTVLDDHFNLYKIDTHARNIKDLGTFPFGDQIKTVPSYFTYVVMHVFSDNTLIFFSHDRESLCFTLGEIKNDKLIMHSMEKFAEIKDSDVFFFPSFPSDKECLLKCGIYPKPASKKYYLNVYSLKKLEMEWKAEEIDSYPPKIASTLHQEHYSLPHPYYVSEKDQYLEAPPDTIINMDTNATYSFRDWENIFRTRNNKLYIIHDDRLLLTSFTVKKTLENEMESIDNTLRSVLPLPNDLVPIVTGYLQKNSIFSSGTLSVDDKENTKVMVDSVSPRPS